MQRHGAPSVQPGLAPPWWIEESGLLDEPEAPSLAAATEVDVAVVGGGYTGLWTALTLRERDPGLRVAVLERARVGQGPSGRNGGHLYGYWSSLAGLRHVLDDDQLLVLARAGDRIIPAFEAFAARRAEDLWLRRDGAIKISTTPAQDTKLDAAVAAADALGAPEEAVLLDRDELAERCRSPRFRRGVFFRDGATLHPGRLVKALRRAVLDDEAIDLYERTPVARLDRGDPTTLGTPGGTVRAREVVLAVNAATTGWRPAAGRLTNFGSYIVLTEPVPDLLDELGWTGGEAITDARMFLHYFRTTRDGRVLMGSGSGPIGLGGRLDERFTHDAATAARAEAGLRHLLPALAAARVTHAWGGPIDVSADRLPFVGTVPGSRVHYAAGFSGNGVGPSWLAAQALASLATGRDDEWTRLPLVARAVRRLPPEPLKRVGGGAVRAAVLAVEEAEGAGRRAPTVARAVASLPGLLGLRIGLR
jgi:glycine/D-amino acid oxidase-like deaminating enzyme